MMNLPLALLLTVASPAAARVSSDELARLVQDLKHQDRAVWVRAHDALLKLGPEAVPAVLSMTGGSGLGRGRAIVLLGNIKDGRKEVLDVLLAALNGADGYDRLSAADALGKIGAPAVPALIVAFKSESREMREHAGKALSLAGPAAAPAIPLLIDALSEDSGLVAAFAEDALEAIGAPARIALIAALSHPSAHKRSNAAGVLGRLADAADVPALTKALADPEQAVRKAAGKALAATAPGSAELARALKDTRPEVRRAAALGLHDEKARREDHLPALLAALQSDPDADVRAEAAAALGLEKPSAASVRALAEAAGKEPEKLARAQAVIALGRIAPHHPAVLRSLEDSTAMVRHQALDALLGWGPVRSQDLPLVRRMLEDNDSALRLKATEALGDAGKDPETAAALTRRLEDPEPFVREAAQTALGKLSPAPAQRKENGRTAPP